MTYCVALKLDRGMIFASDTRTNAGLDNIATFEKMNVWEQAGERVLVLLSAGNLAVTQAVVSLLNEQIANADGDDATLMNVGSMFQAARHVGAALRKVHEIEGEHMGANAENFSASFILGGQVGSGESRLFQIYNEGNFIEATDDTPFFQIGEHKYGKPILDRVTKKDMRLGDAAKLVLISFDSTLRSNLSVGMPIDLLIYQAGTLKVRTKQRIEQDNEYFRSLSEEWSDALRSSFANLDEYPEAGN